LDIAVNALDEARRLGATDAEAFVNDSRTSTIEVRDGEVETLVGAGSRGVGLRVLRDGAVGFAYTSDVTRDSIAEVAQRALRLAQHGSPDPDRRLADPRRIPDEALGIHDPALADVPTEHKIDFLRDAERLARAEDSRVRSTQLARYVDGVGSVALVNSHGISVLYEQSSAYAVLVLVGGQDDEQQLGYAFTFGHGFAELSTTRLARDAARRAVGSLGGRPLPTGRTTVVMEPEIAGEFLGNVAAGLSGDAVLRGRSMFVGKAGQAVAHSSVRLVDQGNLPRGLASAPVDGEGVPTQRTLVMDGGTLHGYLHSLYSARKLGAESTGNARRGSFRGTPEVGPSNFMLEPGSRSVEQLLADVERGFYVITTRNVGGINPISGDYSVGAAGLAIEQGRLTGPVSGVTIAANMHDMLRMLVDRANDLRWVPGAGAIGSPTLRIDGMMVAGG
jgi:PmbA protein